MTINVLFVCLGNICRSPAAEAIFLHKLSEKQLLDKFQVDSAGTGGWHIGRQADSRMRQAASLRGISIRSRARQISLDDFKNFDLILTMDNSNLSDVISFSEQLTVPCHSKIKPLLEYSTSKKDLLEVPDPYYGGEKGFDEVLDLLDQAIDGLINKLNYR